MEGQIAAAAFLHDPSVDRNQDGVYQYVVLEGEPGHQDAIVRTEYSVNTIVSSGIEVENGEKINAKKLCMSAFHTPAFIASVLGILAGLSKVVICLIDSPFGGSYLAVEGILTTSVTAIILMVVGYSMELTKELIRPCLKTILMRVLLQTLMAIGVLWAVHLWIGDNMLLNLAIISYMSAPATFSMQTFLKKEEGSAYVSTTNSMYCMVSILVYIILAAVVY